MTALEYCLRTLGSRLWCKFGLKDAFHPDKDWGADSHLAIDQGMIVVMIENHRSGLCWRLFRANEGILRAQKAAGWSKRD